MCWSGLACVGACWCMLVVSRYIWACSDAVRSSICLNSFRVCRLRFVGLYMVSIWLRCFGLRSFAFACDGLSVRLFARTFVRICVSSLFRLHCRLVRMRSLHFSRFHAIALCVFVWIFKVRGRSYSVVLASLRLPSNIVCPFRIPRAQAPLPFFIRIAERKLPITSERVQ